jgi:hypothetical protein
MLCSAGQDRQVHATDLVTGHGRPRLAGAHQLGAQALGWKVLSGRENEIVIGTGENAPVRTVRPAPAAQELQVHIGQRHPGPGHQRTGTITRTDLARIPSMHCRLPTSQTARSVKDDRNEKEDLPYR